MIIVLQEEYNKSKSISAREITQTNASLVEALAEKVQVPMIHELFKALSKAQEQQLEEQISVLKEQISVSNVERGMAVLQAKSATEMLQMESRKMHDCQRHCDRTCQPRKSWNWSLAKCAIVKRNCQEELRDEL
jgi:hypothetical protein